MKTIYSILFVLVTITFANAQSPVPQPDTSKTQVRQTDPVPDAMPPDASYTQDKIKIGSGELPEDIKRELNSGADYKGWQQGTTYKNKAGDIFILEMQEGDTLRTYRFDPKGKLILE